MTESTVLYTVSDSGIAHVTLNRPDKRNAFNAQVISTLTDTLRQAEDDPRVRVVILDAAGKHFSAGADLNWMRDSAKWSQDDNVRDAHNLATLMDTLDRLAKPTIARVQGAAYGGAVGLVSCCDIAVATTGARFCLSEARLGLAPAVISPYVVRAIGARQARRYFLTTEEIPAARAQTLGLVHEVAADEDLEEIIESLCQTLLNAAPEALGACKALVHRVTGEQPDAQVIDYTAHLIARLRTGAEGQEGLTAFFEKRPPRWKPEQESSHE